MFGEATSEPQQGCDWRLKAGSGFELQQAGKTSVSVLVPMGPDGDTRTFPGLWGSQKRDSWNLSPFQRPGYM